LSRPSLLYCGGSRSIAAYERPQLAFKPKIIRFGIRRWRAKQTTKSIFLAGMAPTPMLLKVESPRPVHMRTRRDEWKLLKRNLLNRNLPKSCLRGSRARIRGSSGGKPAGSPRQNFVWWLRRVRNPQHRRSIETPLGNSDENAVLASCDFKRAADETCRTRQK
jgi:hypothetical protein